MEIKNVATEADTRSTAKASAEGHKLEMELHRSMSVTGVKAVPVFTDRNMTVRLEGETLAITGRGLAVKTLDVEHGKLSVTGDVLSLKFTGQTDSFAKRLFK